MQKIKQVLKGSDDSVNQHSNQGHVIGNDSTTRRTSTDTPIANRHSLSSSTNTSSTNDSSSLGRNSTPATSVPTSPTSTKHHHTETADPDAKGSLSNKLPGHNHKDRQTTNEFDLNKASHEHHHLGHKTHEKVHEHEIEEVERERVHDKHVHHVQHHTQRIQQTEHKDAIHHQNVIPTTKISERHATTDEDHKALGNLVGVHRDETTTVPKTRQVVDLGEKVTENIHHHVKNVIQPILEKETHHHHVTHTVIPTHHETHEAPIIHQSIEHPAMSHDEFLKSGGKFGTGNSDHTSLLGKILPGGDCERTVDGVGEKMTKDLNLGATTHKGTTNSTTATGATNGLRSGSARTSGVAATGV